jgi:hypothetical protein
MPEIFATLREPVIDLVPRLARGFLCGPVMSPVTLSVIHDLRLLPIAEIISARDAGGNHPNGVNTIEC